MIYPTIQDLTKDKINRYELAIATAKCARIITDEYVREREAAEKMAAANKESDKAILNMVTKEYRDEKAVKCAIKRMHTGEFAILSPEEAEIKRAQRAAEAEQRRLEEEARRNAPVFFGDEDDEEGLTEEVSEEDEAEEIEE
ncbi:MAG: hypothetical protein II297_04640 [Clostridia bacterium]|jgi:DNA-directed RNA polymerase subunit K/omega|nr:hypothetical protein [Clostridia bacterium]